MRTTCTLQCGNNYMVVSDYDPSFVREVIRPFCRRYLYRYGVKPVPGSNQKQKYVSHVFARMNADESEVRMSIGLKSQFISFMQSIGFTPSRIKETTLPIIKGTPVNFTWADGWGNPRENQQEWVDYQLAPGGIKINNAQTGQGKTFMATHTMVNTGMRTLVTCLPKFKDIWINNFAEKLKLFPGEIMDVGESSLEALIDTFTENETVTLPNIVILPLTRIMIYLQRMKDDPTLPCLDSIYESMGIGLRIMDESHESIHQVYLSMMYGNFEKTIALSATLKADDQLNNQVYGYIFPKSARLKEPEYHKYIDVYAYWHSIDTGKYRLRTQGFGGYSHMYYEKSIMKSKVLFNYYVGLMDKAFREFYLEHEDYEPNQRVLFFFYTVEMCEKVMKRFKSLYPDFDIVKYTNAESKKKDLTNSYAEHGFVFTTAKSCGTGKDIPYLYVVFSPLAVSSIQLNNQMLGRLRTVEKWWPGKNPKFVFFVCKDIEKQVEYASKRKECFADKSLSFTNVNSFYNLT